MRLIYMLVEAMGCSQAAPGLSVQRMHACVICVIGVIGNALHCAGTAMHHAAMSNHRELMVALARMGCDPLARADGIQGATAAFVLCSQHAKTSQQLVRRLQPDHHCRSWLLLAQACRHRTS